MADPRRPDPDRGAPPRMPRWVTLSMIIVAALVVLAVAVAVLSGGQHGPGRHVGAGDPGPTRATATPLASDMPRASALVVDDS